MFTLKSVSLRTEKKIEDDESKVIADSIRIQIRKISYCQINLKHSVHFCIM